MARIIELIYTEQMRGSGVEGNPFRKVPQLWSTDGNLVCEDDPSATSEDRRPADLSPHTLGDSLL